MPWRAFLFALSICQAPGPATAQPSLAPPVVNRPAQFSGVVGDFTIRATATPTEVQVEEPIVLRVTLEASGAVPAEYQPNAKKLKLFPPGFDEDYYVEERRDEHQLDPAENRWTFVYRVRPKSQQVQAIEDLAIVYWQPRVRKFQTKYADPIALKVGPRRDPALTLPSQVALAPASFHEIPDAAKVLASSAAPGAPTWEMVAAACVAPPALALLGVLLWRRRHSEDAEKRRRAPRRVLQESLDALRQNSPLWVVLQSHLAERWDFAAEQPTPAEAARFLRRRGFAKPLCERVETLLRRCDAARYAPSPPADPALRDALASLLRDLEGDPCA